MQPIVVDKGSVRAAQVFDNHVMLLFENLGVQPRHSSGSVTIIG